MEKACAQCKVLLLPYQMKYCSNSCQKDHEYGEYIQQWLAGVKDGNRGKQTRNLSGHIIRYLFEKYNSRCSLCGWSIAHAQTNRPPLEVDHIDGDAENNAELNLRLLCPNCHSLTSNYRNLNKGSGRVWRREKYVKIEQLPL